MSFRSIAGQRARVIAGALSFLAALVAVAARAQPTAATPMPPGPVPPIPPGAPAPLADAPALVWRGQRFELGAFYAARAVAAGLPIDNGPGFSLGLSDEIPRRTYWPRLFDGAWISAQVLWPETVTTTAAAVRFETIAARLGLELGLRDLRLRLGVGWDFVHLSTALTGAPAAPDDSRWTTLFAYETSVRAAVLHVGSCHLWLNLFADISSTAVEYVVVDAGGAFQPVFSPWRVRPGLALELVFP